MFEDRSGDKEDTTLDPNEAMLSMKRGLNSVPWHPASMSAPYIYKVTLLGACGTGKSSFAHRLVAHTFDSTYRASRAPAQLFWRHTEVATGRDIMMEIEDMPGVTPEVSPSEELTHRGRAEVEKLLYPLCWFEKRRKDKEGAKRDPRLDEQNPLLPGGGVKVASSSSGKKRGGGGGLGDLSKSMSSMAAQAGALASSAFGGAESKLANPIGEDRKRMGFIILADLSSNKSFAVAYAIVDRLFDRLQFDVSDNMTAPVSVVIAGNKCDLRGNRREAPPEAAIRAEIQGRYYNRHSEPQFAVDYVECSAQTNYNLDTVMLTSLERIRMLPTRNRIRSSRMRATGFFATFKKNLYACCPQCFEIEECCKFTFRSILRPCFKKLGLYSLIFECKPCMKVMKFFTSLISTLFAFRWLCDWCPPFVLRLRKEVTAEEEDAEAEGGGGEKEEEDEA